MIQASAKDEGDDVAGSFQPCFLCLAHYSHITSSHISLLPGRNGSPLWWTLPGTGITAGWLSLLFLFSTTGACLWPGELGYCRAPVSSNLHLHLLVVAQMRLGQLVLVTVGWWEAKGKNQLIFCWKRDLLASPPHPAGLASVTCKRLMLSSGWC